MSVILNGYEYEIVKFYDNNGNPIEVNEADELETTIGLDKFLEGIKIYSDKEIERLSHKRKKFGLIGEVVTELYEAFFDLVYYGNEDKNWFLKTFNLSESELCKILA